MDATAFVLEVTLRDIRPPIWRRVRVPAQLTLAQLHAVLQIAIGWTDSHLHAFDVRGTSYGPPSEDGWGPSPHDERKVRLAQIAATTKKFRYDYDYGDGWQHDLVVERADTSPEAASQIVCIDGRRACPPEDCGGPPGYEDLLEIVGDPDHPEHEERVEWVGEDWQPEAFDLASVNRHLATLARRMFRAKKTTRRVRGMPPSAND